MKIAPSAVLCREPPDPAPLPGRLHGVPPVVPAGPGHDVVDRAVQVHGARGLTDETPLAGMLSLARGARIYDGPDEVHRMVVARRILKSFAAGEPWRFE